MLCKWCGMESVTTDQCSWCHRALSAAPAENPEAVAAPDVPPAEAAEPASVIEIGAQSSGDAQAKSEGAVEALPPAEEEVSSKAPWTIAPAPPIPPPSASAPPAGGSPETARPIIGVRRPTEKRAGPGRPAPAMPPPAVSRKSGVAGGAAGSASHTPAPAVPPARRVVPPAGGASARSQSSAAGAAMSGSATSAANPVPRSRPAVPAALTGARPAPSAPIPAGGKPPAAPLLGAEEMTLPEVEEGNVPSLGTFTPAKSKYYVGQVVDPVSGTHYNADTGQPVSGPMGSAARLGNGSSPVTMQPSELDEVASPRSPLIGLGWYAAALGIILFFTGLFAFVSTAHYVLPLLAAQFFGAMLMPVMRVVPWADEDADDAVLFVLLTLACGPIVGLIIYGVISMMRQDTNPAILGCFIVAALARLVVEAAVGVTGEGGGFAITQLAPFAQVQHFDIRLLLINWSGLVALAGWYTASIFHKLDE